jgi:biotin operon repressor
MARPTARVLALLELLQAGGTRTVAELAERLGVDDRTVRRYVEHLRDLDIPVDAVRGRYGGYRLARHYRMPPLMLTDEEAPAVVWALLFDRRSHAGPASSLAVDNAMAKVRRVLPDTLARRIDAVLETVDFTGVPSDGGRDDEGVKPRGHREARTLLDLAEAARSVTFAAPGDMDPVAQVVGPLTAAPWRHEVSVLINADPAYVQTRIPDTLASVTPASEATGGDGWLRVFLRAERLEWVAATLAALDRPFVIEQPPALHEVVHELGRRLIEDSARRTITGEGPHPSRSVTQ